MTLIFSQGVVLTHKEQIAKSGPTLACHNQEDALGIYQVEAVCQSLGRVRLLSTPQTVAYQAPLSMGILQARLLEWIAISFSRGSSQPGIEPRSPTLQVDSLPSEPLGKPKME